MNPWEKYAESPAQSSDGPWAKYAAPESPKSAATPEPEAKTHSFLENAAGAVLEPIAAMGSGMIAKPVSDIAGLAATGKEMVSPTPGGGDPAGFAREVQEKLTYQPRTAAGKATTEYNPLALIGKGIGMAGDKAQEIAAPPKTSGPVQSAVGAGIGEFIKQIPGLFGAKLGGKVAEGLPAKQAGLDIAKGENAAADSTRDAAEAAGYKRPAEGGIKAAVQGLGGKARSERGLSIDNAENATKRLSQEVGVSDGRALSKEEFGRLKEDAGQSYDAVTEAAGPKLQVTPQFEQSLKGTLGQVNNLLAYNRETYEGLVPAQRLIKSYLKKIEAPDVAPPMKGGPAIMNTLTKAAQEQPYVTAGKPGQASGNIGQTLEKAASDVPHHFGIPEAPQTPIAATRNATMDTKATFKAIQDLRRYAKEDFAKQNSDMGTARLGIANQLENLIEDNLRKTGQQGLVDQFKQARQRFAKIYLLERVTNEATGKVDLSKLASLSETKAYKGILTGEFKTAADFAKAYRKAAQKPTGEVMPSFSVFDGMFALGSVAAGHPLAAAAEIGGRLGIPAMTRAGMLQNKSPSYRAGQSAPNVIRGVGAASDPNQINNPPQ